MLSPTMLIRRRRAKFAAALAPTRLGHRNVSVHRRTKLRHRSPARIARSRNRRHLLTHRTCPDLASHATEEVFKALLLLRLARQGERPAIQGHSVAALSKSCCRVRRYDGRCAVLRPRSDDAPICARTFVEPVAVTGALSFRVRRARGTNPKRRGFVGDERT